MGFRLDQEHHTLSRLKTRSPQELQPSTLEALDGVRANGKLADVYLQFANSEPALMAYLHMESSLKEGSLTSMELEAVKLWVSEHSGCDFCLSVHSFKARQAGIDTTQQLAIRSGESSGNARIDALLEITSAVLQQRGSIAPQALEDARTAGLSDENLVDLSMAISTILFTNMTNHINDTRSSLQAAPTLKQQ